MKKTALVTGGAGFLGSHLCDALLERGRQVICYDDLSTGARGNIAHLFGRRDFEFIQGDVTKPLDLPKEDLAEIYSLACPASPIHYQRDPIKTIKTNFVGTLNALDIAYRTGAKILLASTSEVYGDPAEHPQQESYWGNVNPVGLRSCYDEGKRAAECLMMDYHRQLGIDARIIRIFNTYGPKMAKNDGRVVSNFIVQAILGDDMTIYGDGRQTRSFCYVDDLIEGLILAMNSDSERIIGNPVNMGNPDERTIIDIASIIIRLARSKSRLVFKELPSDDPQRRSPDIAFAQRTLKWSPRVALEEGLKRTIEYFQKKLEEREEW